MYVDRDFARQLDGFSLATVEIHYYLPDHPSLLQQFVWQQYDMAPRFPALARFLDHWRREIEAPIHSIRVAHKQLLGPTDCEVHSLAIIIARPLAIGGT